MWPSQHFNRKCCCCCFLNRQMKISNTNIFIIIFQYFNSKSYLWGEAHFRKLYFFAQIIFQSLIQLLLLNAMKILYFCLGITDSQLSGTEWKLCAFNIQNNNKKKRNETLESSLPITDRESLLIFFYSFTLFKVLLFALKHFIHTLHLTTQLSSLCLFISCFTFMFFL